MACPSSASRATGAADSRIRVGRATVGGEAKRVGAVELEQVGEQLELIGQLGVSAAGLAATRGDDMQVRLAICLPTYNERENLEPMIRRSPRSSRPMGSTAACS